MSTNTNNYIYCQGSSKFLYFIFGGVMNGFGMPRYEFERTAKSEGIDCYLFRDLSQSWYSLNNDEILSDITRILNKSKKPVIFVGNSMGGFAAIKYGIKLKIATIIAFSPQYSVNLIDKLKLLDPRWLKILLKSPKSYLKNQDILGLSLLLKGNTQSKIKIYYGSENKLDERNVNAIVKDSINELLEVKPYNTSGHSLVKDLRDNNKLFSIISQCE